MLPRARETGMNSVSEQLVLGLFHPKAGIRKLYG